MRRSGPEMGMGAQARFPAGRLGVLKYYIHCFLKPVGFDRMNLCRLSFLSERI